MTRRRRSRTRFRPVVPVMALLVGVLAFSARPASAQWTTKWIEPPEDRADPGVTLGAGFAVAHDAERPVELVVSAHRIRDGRVVATHRSASFRVAPDRPFRLHERYLPAPRFYDGKVAGEIVIARSPVPLASGDRDANVWWQTVQERADITDWEAGRDVEKWKQRDALVLVVTPADPRLRREAMVHPMLVRLEAPVPERRRGGR